MGNSDRGIILVGADLCVCPVRVWISIPIPVGIGIEYVLMSAWWLDIPTSRD